MDRKEAEGNLLNGTAEDLKEALKALQNRDELKEQLYDLQENMDQLQGDIRSLKKEEDDEIRRTLKTRRAEVAAGYDSQLEESGSELKRAENLREKQKKEEVSGRIEDETADLKTRNQDQEKQLKSLFRENRVPGFSRRKGFYHLFMPEGGSEILKCILGFLTIFGVIPALAGIVTHIVCEQNADLSVRTGTALTILIPAALLILFLILYFLIYVKVKVRHLEVLKEGRKIRSEIRQNEKKIRRITHGIRKDRDESQYGLESFDEDIERIREKRKNLRTEKDQALEEFDKTTAKAVTEDIRRIRRDDLTDKSSSLAEMQSQSETVKEKLQTREREIATRYQAYLGEEYCNQETVRELLRLMESEGVSSVSEAIRLMKQRAETDQTEEEK